jgi:hypothetical protein
MPIIGLTVKVQHEASGKWVRLPLEPQADAAKCFRDLSAEVSRRFGDAKFSLHLHPEKRTAAAPEALQLESAPLDHVTKAEWTSVLAGCTPGGTLALLARAATAASPASWVDPFCASATMKLCPYLCSRARPRHQERQRDRETQRQRARAHEISWPLLLTAVFVVASQGRASAPTYLRRAALLRRGTGPRPCRGTHIRGPSSPSMRSQ